MKVTASALNIRSGPGTDFRVVGKVTKGVDVEVLEVHGDWAWVEAGSWGNGWVNQAYIAVDAKAFGPPAPNEIERVFGEPCTPACSAGRVELPLPLKLGWANARVTRVACHVLMVPIFTAVFHEIHAAGLWSELETFDGIYNCRAIKGSQNRSTHSWGISVDLNAAKNPMGLIGEMDPRIIAIFNKHGFHWGGRFSRRDDMHFEFVKRS